MLAVNIISSSSSSRILLLALPASRRCWRTGVVLPSTVGGAGDQAFASPKNYNP